MAEMGFEFVRALFEGRLGGAISLRGIAPYYFTCSRSSGTTVISRAERSRVT